MATSSIDLQCGQQIKPQDKRLGRRTMEEHSGPHGKRMTTGRSGRPQPHSFQEGAGLTTRDEKRLVNRVRRNNEAAHCGEFFHEKIIRRSTD